LQTAGAWSFKPARNADSFTLPGALAGADADSHVALGPAIDGAGNWSALKAAGVASALSSIPLHCPSLVLAVVT
jgi:hypothetical protein